jgi:hypothetical protein
VSEGEATGVDPVSTRARHQMTFATFDGGPNNPAGWSGSFQLARATAVGGVVIQKVQSTINGVPQPTYWEVVAYIRPGARSSGREVDDSWTSPNDGTHGSETTIVSATFYEGLTMTTLPSLFRKEGESEAGFAPISFTDPTNLLPRPSSTPLLRRGIVRY